MPEAEKRCIWCGGREHLRQVKFAKGQYRMVTFCSDECERKTRGFLEFDGKYSSSFYWGELILCFACIVLTLSKLPAYALAVVGFMGVLMVPFPFLAAIMGGTTNIRRAILTTRSLGVVMAAVGFSLFLFLYGVL
jgi:hypothetical protein